MIRWKQRGWISRQLNELQNEQSFSEALWESVWSPPSQVFLVRDMRDNKQALHTSGGSSRPQRDKLRLAVKWPAQGDTWWMSHWDQYSCPPRSNIEVLFYHDSSPSSSWKVLGHLGRKMMEGFNPWQDIRNECGDFVNYSFPDPFNMTLWRLGPSISTSQKLQN